MSQSKPEAAWGAGDFAGSVFAGSAFAGWGVAASPLSILRIKEPCETLSPSLITSSFTTPASGAGISIVALSDSNEMSDCSFVTESPGFTSISITSTSLKSPMSGTFTSIVVLTAGSCGCRRGRWRGRQ